MILSWIKKNFVMDQKNFVMDENNFVMDENNSVMEKSKFVMKKIILTWLVWATIVNRIVDHMDWKMTHEKITKLTFRELAYIQSE